MIQENRALIGELMNLAEERLGYAHIYEASERRRKTKEEKKNLDEAEEQKRESEGGIDA